MSLDLFDILWQEILNDPEEDLPRLAYADALDDRGGKVDLVRADFIRAQIEKNRIPDKEYRCTEMDPNFMPQRVIGGWTSQTACGKCQCCQLKQRIAGALQILSDYTELRHWPTGGRINPLSAQFFFRRGFISETYLLPEEWQKWGKRLCRKWPITLVVLKGKRPDNFDSVTFPNCWYRASSVGRIDGDHSRTIPGWLWKQTLLTDVNIATFPTKEKAMEWLSTLCLRWAREKRRVFI